MLCSVVELSAMYHKELRSPVGHKQIYKGSAYVNVSVWEWMSLYLIAAFLLKLGNSTRITNPIWHKKIDNHINAHNDNSFIE